MNKTTIDGYTRGNAYHLTGETRKEYGRTWLLAIFLEGCNKGKTISIMSDEDKAKAVAEHQVEFDRRQEGYRRLKDLAAL